MNNVFTIEHMFTDEKSTTQSQALASIAQHAHTLGYIDNIDLFIQGLIERESFISTGFLEGIAIPHCKSECVKKPAIFVVHFEHPIAWKTLDDQPVTTAVSFAIPNKGDNESLKILITLSRSMINQNIRSKLKQRSPLTILNTIEQLIA